MRHVCRHASVQVSMCARHACVRHVCRHASVQVSMYAGMHVCRYACVQAGMCAGMHVSGMCAGRHVCRYAYMQVCIYAGRHVCKAGMYAGTHVSGMCAGRHVCSESLPVYPATSCFSSVSSFPPNFNYVSKKCTNVVLVCVCQLDPNELLWEEGNSVKELLHQVCRRQVEQVEQVCGVLPWLIIDVRGPGPL